MYRLPPEWSAQSAVLLTWPHEGTDWLDLAATERCFESIVHALRQRAQVIVICHDKVVLQRVQQRVAKPADVNLPMFPLHCVCIANNDSWARDHGPLTVLDLHNNPVWLDFQFTGWGHKYQAHFDDAIVERLAGEAIVNITERLRIPVALEGGALETDGAGTLLVSKRCILHENRQNALEQPDFEALFNRYLGCSNVLWLEHGALQGDDTDAHIDTLARFTPHHGIVYAACDDASDPHFAELARMQRQLAQFVDANGAPYTLFALPWPPPIFNATGQRLPASYANFLILNGAVFVPTYGVATDDAAVAVIRRAFVDYDIVAIDCRALLEQYGSLHCVTMQLPMHVIKGI